MHSRVLISVSRLHAVYVRVTTDTALRRNERRDRKVPVEHMLSYQRALEEAVELERPHADTFEVLDNDDDDPGTWFWRPR